MKLALLAWTSESSIYLIETKAGCFVLFSCFLYTFIYHLHLPRDNFIHSLVY